MSDQLPPHELELMNLFDRDLSQKQRDRLIELLSNYPELSEKYAFYLHLQDLEMKALPEVDPMIRKRLLKMAAKQTHKIKFAAKMQAIINALTHPLVAAPATLCLVFLVGYELMDSSDPSQDSLVSSQFTMTDLIEDDELQAQEERDGASKDQRKAAPERKSETRTKVAKQRSKKPRTQKKRALNTQIPNQEIPDSILANKTVGTSSEPLMKGSSNAPSSTKAQQKRKKRRASRPSSKVRSPKAVNRENDLSRALSESDDATRSLEVVLGDFDAQGDSGALIGSRSDSDRIAYIGGGAGGDGAGNGSTLVESTGQTRGRLGAKRTEGRAKSKRRSVNRTPQTKNKTPMRAEALQEREVEARLGLSNDVESQQKRGDVLPPTAKAAPAENVQSSRAINSQPSYRAKSRAKSVEANSPDPLNRALNRTEQELLLSAKSDLNFKSSESVTILRIARLALRANDLSQATIWTEWVIRRNDESLRAALKLQERLRQLERRQNRRK